MIDNSSSDKTVDIVKNEYPNVNLITLDSNIGFGAAHNKVLSLITSNYHLIVNPDIFFSTDTLEEMVNYLDNMKDISMVSPKIKNEDGTEQYLPKVNPKFKYFIGGRFEKYGGIFAKWRAEYTRKNELIIAPVDIDFCTGCFMLVRTDILWEVNGFDERYFLHFEDADLTREVKVKGRVVFNPNFEVTHLWKRDNVKSLKVFCIALNSMYKYFRKWGLN